MAAQVADDVQAVLPTAGSIAYLLAKQLERLSAAEAREAAALLNLDRAKEWLTWHQEQDKVYEYRIGSLQAEAREMATLAHRARRDQWLTVLVAVVIVLVMLVVCLVALVVR